MKRFFFSFLGALAGVWVSILLFGLLIFITIGVIAASSASEVDVPKVKKQSVLTITLSGEVVDRESPKNIIDEIYGNDVRQLPLNTLVSAIKSAAQDSKIEGIYLDCKGVSAGLAQIEAVVNALNEFSKSGKWIMAYGDSYSQADYIIASTADSLFVNPIGVIDIHGLASTTLYFKNLLEKAGVEVQVVKVGTFKSAVEPFILNDMSEANRLQTSEFLDNIWDHLKNTIAQGRKVTVEKVSDWADSFSYTKDVEFYLKNNLADATLYSHQMDSLLARLSGMHEDKDKPNLIEFDKYALARDNDKKSVKNKKQIAVLYAVGDITENGEGGIASERLVPQILDLAEDDDVDALVLRVNSGGGSAFASEQIWEALQQFKTITGKPFYVSMGDYAASGGYYISCGADKIFAEPVTLTGSIGIFGLIPNAEKLLSDKIGINTATVATNKGQFPTFYKAMTPDQKAAMQSMVENGYELFAKRCAEGRGLPVDSIKAIAEGRVWSGHKALEIGLVDYLGGLDTAVAFAASELNCDGDYYIKEYPKVNFKWWEEMLDMSKTIKMSVIKEFVGEENMKFYDLTNYLKNIDPLQARMDFIEIN